MTPEDVSTPDAAETATLLVLLPGAYMKPDDYKGVIAGLRVNMLNHFHTLENSQWQFTVFCGSTCTLPNDAIHLA